MRAAPSTAPPTAATAAGQGVAVSAARRVRRSPGPSSAQGWAGPSTGGVGPTGSAGVGLSRSRPDILLDLQSLDHAIAQEEAFARQQQMVQEELDQGVTRAGAYPGTHPSTYPGPAHSGGWQGQPEHGGVGGVGGGHRPGQFLSPTALSPVEGNGGQSYGLGAHSLRQQELHASRQWASHQWEQGEGDGEPGDGLEEEDVRGSLVGATRGAHYAHAPRHVHAQFDAYDAPEPDLGGRTEGRGLPLHAVEGVEGVEAEEGVGGEGGAASPDRVMTDAEVDALLSASVLRDLGTA